MTWFFFVLSIWLLVGCRKSLDIKPDFDVVKVKGDTTGKYCVPILLIVQY